RESPSRETAGRRNGHRSRRIVISLCGSVWCFWSATAMAADLGEVEALFRQGRYEECTQMAAAEIRNGSGARAGGWRAVERSAELARGEYGEAMASLENGLRRFPASISLRLLGREVYRYNGRDRDAASELDTIERLVVGAPQRYATPEGRIALGRYFLLR